MQPVDEHAPELGHEDERHRSLRRAATITACLGMAHALLFLLAYWLMSKAPDLDAPAVEVAEFYQNNGDRRVLLVGLYVAPFAGIAFIWFSVALRMWIEASARRVSYLLSNIQLVAAIVYVTLFFGGAASMSVTAATVEFTDANAAPNLTRGFPELGSTMLFVFAFRMASMFVLTTSSIGRASKILPRWFALAGYAVGLFLLLSASFQPWFALVFPVWLLALSALLFTRARRIPAQLVMARPELGRLRTVSTSGLQADQALAQQLDADDQQ